ncbi:hypothetical protein FH972_003920 [Carpinus fangiana]|nr:hypothetical protein FH972_003920 [Carpinus fangiana]
MKSRSSVALGYDRDRDSSEIRQSNFVRSQSVTAGHNRDSIGRMMSIVDIPSPPAAGTTDQEASSSPKSPSGSDSGYYCSTSSPSPRRVADVTLSSWKEANEFSGPSPGSCYSSISYVDVGSPLPPQIPRLVSSASTISACSSININGALINAVDEGEDDSTDLYERLQQVMEDNEKETLRRQRAERDVIEAKRRGQEESRQRKEAEEALVKAKEELENVKNQRDQVKEELGISQEHELSLKIHIAELQKVTNELQMERDNALKEVEELRSRKQVQFSEFKLSEIEEATQNFDESRKIGQGGYGSIYKGLLRQKEVAIKMLQSPGAHGTSQFQMEVSVLSQLRHQNLVKLIGSCPEVFALIYEYLPNGSLEDRLSMKDNSPPLSWQTRIRIATELCSVLVYLHSAKSHSIVHGDLKPSNILLDANFVSKLSDFGICRMLFSDASSSDNINTTLSHITVPKGSFSFIDPEFLETGVLTLKSDVYSFGIILLQLLTGRQPLKITNDVKYALDAGNLKALLDPLAGDWPILAAQELARLGLRCCNKNRRSRPELGPEVWKVLEPMRASYGP